MIGYDQLSVVLQLREQRIADLEQQIERAYQQLEINGDPRERAKSVSNGIDVLVTRLAREVADLEQQRNEERKKHEASVTINERLLSDNRILTERCDELATAAQAVIDRWDTPLWKDVPATAEFINALRAAVARVKS